MAFFAIRFRVMTLGNLVAALMAGPFGLAFPLAELLLMADKVLIWKKER